MSVPKNMRSQGKLMAQTAAYDFASYTHRICSNEKVFLKRNRWCSTEKIVGAADEIAIAVDMANEVNIRNGDPEKTRRRAELQEQAIGWTVRLECLMEIAYRDNNAGGEHIDDDRMSYWISSLLGLRSLIRRWRDGDRHGAAAARTIRSPNTGNGNNARNVNTNGNVNNNNAVNGNQAAVDLPDKGEQSKPTETPAEIPS